MAIELGKEEGDRRRGRSGEKETAGAGEEGPPVRQGRAEKGSGHAGSRGPGRLGGAGKA